ncbi:MAG: methyltransferase [Pseudomonadota bacterium]
MAEMLGEEGSRGSREGPLARWRAAFLDWRNRTVASPAFQRWAASFPLTRPVANAEARRLFEITAGFVNSQVLGAAVRLGLFEMLAEGPLSAETIALRSGLKPEAALRLCEAAAALGLLSRRPGREGRVRFGLGQLGAALRGNPGVVAMIRHHDMLYRDLADPLALLRGEADPETGRFWAYARDPGGQAQLAQSFGAEAVADYSALMAASQQFIAEDVLSALPLRRYRRLLDLGGGEGAFLMAAGAAAPHLQLRLFDLPAVADRARARFAEAGLGDRAEAHGGDFFASALPGGCDAVSLVRVLYDHDDAFVRRLLERARAALAPGGTLIVAEPMAGLPGARAIEPYFAFYLLAMRSGRLRRPDEIAALLRDAGFRAVRRQRTRRPLLTGLVTAHA